MCLYCINEAPKNRSSANGNKSGNVDRVFEFDFKKLLTFGENKGKSKNGDVANSPVGWVTGLRLAS